MNIGGENQSQSAGDNSNNYQVKGDLTVQGVDVDTARAIALNVFTENFVQLSRDAADLAAGRAQRLVEDYIKKQQESAPQNLRQVNDPDFQSALFQAQKSFARSGDENLEELLVDILVERSSEPKRNLRQIVLNESIDTVAKLTQEHVDIITFIFLARYTSIASRNSAELAAMWAPLLRFAPAVGTDETVFSYLDYVGVASVSMMRSTLVDAISNHGSGYLSKGFDPAEGEALAKQDYRVRPLLRQSTRNPDKVEIAVANVEVLKARVQELGIPPNIEAELTARLAPLMIPPAERKDFFSKLIPGFAEVEDRCDKSVINGTTLTPVGFAIAHSNAKRAGLAIGPLEIWVK